MVYRKAFSTTQDGVNSEGLALRKPLNWAVADASAKLLHFFDLWRLLR
jgi:hypothetical protein